METSPAESQRKVSDTNNPCWETSQRHLFALGVTSDDGREYFFATAQFIEAELTANAETEDHASASPDLLRVRYATGEIVILGRELRWLVRWLQRGELENLRPMGRRYAGLTYKGPIISSVTVTRTEDV